MFTISWFGATAIVISCLSNTAPKECEVYRNGHFYIVNKISRQRINIERRDSLQVETNAETGDITVMKVKWTDSCAYELLFNYMTPKDVAKTNNVQRIIQTSVELPLRIKILSGTDSYYVFDASKEGFQNLRDTVWLVK